MTAPFLRPLGSADWLQTKGNDNSCYTLSDRLLIDCNSALVMNLLNHDIDPLEMNTVLFTHMHIDHCMGLAGLLMYWRIQKGDLGLLTIAGPAATVRDQVMRTLDFVFHDSRDRMAEIKRLPNIIELSGDGTFDHPDFTIAYTDSDHAVPGLCYRITDKATGHTVGLSGDTLYQPKYGAFFRDVDLLAYECSYGAGPLDDFAAVCRHSSAREAAAVANESAARRLMLTHTYEPKREAALAEAQRRTSIPVLWATPFVPVAF